MSGRGRHVVLRTGQHMPLLGLGCSQMGGEELSAAVTAALDAGYRLVDTAYFYGNEGVVGEALRRWLGRTGTPREDIFVVTKLPNIGMHTGGPEKFLKKSLDQLRLDYVDLYLVHTPVGYKAKNDTDVFPRDDQGYPCLDDATDIISVWKEMEKVAKAGLAKNIGVSNFNIKQLRKVIANATILPAVLQVELNVYLQQPQVQEYCRRQNIVITAYAPFGSPGRFNTGCKSGSCPCDGDGGCGWVLEDPVVRLVAENHSITPAQVLLRFLVQQNIATIPKSANPTRIAQNNDIWGFKLTETEMEALKTRDKGEAGRRFGPNYAYYQRVRDHPEFPH